MEGTSADCENSDRKSAESENARADKCALSPSSSGYPRQAEKRLKRDSIENPESISERDNNEHEPINILPKVIPGNSMSLDPITCNNTQEATNIEDENIDSGISIEKPESPNSENLVPSLTSERSVQESEIDNRPSTSSLTRDSERSSRTPRARNYRTRRQENAPAADSDEDTEMNIDYQFVHDSLMPTLLNIVAESAEVANRDSNSADEQPALSDVRRSLHLELLYARSDSDDSNPNNEDNQDSGSNIETDSDDWSDMESSTHNDESNSDYETPSVLLKRKPSHTWNVIRELTNRERGYGLGYRKMAKTDVLFEQRFYGSLHTVERLELMYKLNKHKGCVNSINFHPEGELFVSGSDDLNVVIWDWATNTSLQTIKSGHKTNIFQSKFLHLNAASQLNIVTCARDGQVRLIQVPPSGGTVFKRRLAVHSRPAYKLYVSPAEPHVIISSGEDGLVMLSDVRQEGPNKLLKVKYRGAPVALYSIDGHPLNTNELCVAGRNRLVKVYDRRKAGNNASAIKSFCPEYFLRPDNGSNKRMKGKFTSLYVTCAIYNHDGSEILASYNDDDIYLFDSILDNDPQPGSHGFTYRYSGHRNCATFKGVSFFGPHSEFIMSGSDCGNIYTWEKKTEAIVQWMMGDESGIVNSIDCHPRCPVIATCGLDNDIKIWVPSNENEPKLTGLKEAVTENSRAQLRSPLTFLPGLQGIWGRDLFRTGINSQDDTGDDNASNEQEVLDFENHICRPF